MAGPGGCVESFYLEPQEPMWQVAMAHVTETEKEIVAVSL